MTDETSVILTRYNEKNELIIPCLRSLSNQIKSKLEIYFLDQKRDKNIEGLCKNISNKYNKINYINIPSKSLSFARNFGIRISKTDVVLFIDCDAIPKEDWAFELTKVFEIDKKIGVVGGRSLPKWLAKPRWFNKSNIAMEVYSLIDLSDKTISTTKIVGVNFGMKKSLVGKEAKFDESLGRRPGSLLGGEETDFCRRVLNKNLIIYYSPKAIVEHQIQTDRMSLRWLMRRFYYGGLGKAMMGGTPQTYSPKRNIYDKILLLFIVIPYFVGFVKGRLLWHLKR